MRETERGAYTGVGVATSGDDGSVQLVVLLTASLLLFPMLGLLLLVPILAGIIGGEGVLLGSPFSSVLTVGWLVIVFVVFVLGTTVSAQLIQLGRRDLAREELRLALAHGSIDSEEFERRLRLLEDR